MVVGQGFFYVFNDEDMCKPVECVRLLSSSCRMWSSEMIMLYQSAWE